MPPGIFSTSLASIAIAITVPHPARKDHHRGSNTMPVSQTRCQFISLPFFHHIRRFGIPASSTAACWKVERHNDPEVLFSCFLRVALQSPQSLTWAETWWSPCQAYGARLTWRRYLSDKNRHYEGDRGSINSFRNKRVRVFLVFEDYHV